VWAITGSGKDVIAKGFVLLLAGIPVYIGVRWWQARQIASAPVAVPAAARDGVTPPAPDVARRPQ
jgi:hypothetical protein